MHRGVPLHTLVFFVTRGIFHQIISASTRAELLAAFPSTSFFGTSFVGGLFGTSSGISISVSIIIAVGLFDPLSVVLLETSTRTHIGGRG